ncbi:phosphoribosyltransferase [Phreatobacter stygius]|uniref:Phosphoribosyltransferase n=1 Tax=Phreatobacter stygius TaxID=1940610 RepID=A0A4D7ARP2_9HYPH|nr:phosphoribosyltransferase family protein [Phreatobacter stygius]QCI64064.1 phosphoribosyltransferase [Phreatobacter stygius]
MLRDRQDAGRLLAARLSAMTLDRPVVLALPRGGVPVAAEIATILGAPLDLVLVRKIGAPAQPELALGAVVEGAEADIVLDDVLLRYLHVGSAQADQLVARARAELERRGQRYRACRSPVELAGRDVIIVDDGIATGASIRVAIQAVRRRRPGRIILAVPVAAADQVTALQAEVDVVVCQEAPADLSAVSRHYLSFPQVDDAEVIACLEAAGRRNQDP